MLLFHAEASGHGVCRHTTAAKFAILWLLRGDHVKQAVWRHTQASMGVVRRHSSLGLRAGLPAWRLSVLDHDNRTYCPSHDALNNDREPNA